MIVCIEERDIACTLSTSRSSTRRIVRLFTVISIVVSSHFRVTQAGAKSTLVPDRLALEHSPTPFKIHPLSWCPLFF